MTSLMPFNDLLNRFKRKSDLKYSHLANLFQMQTLFIFLISTLSIIHNPHRNECALR